MGVSWGRHAGAWWDCKGRSPGARWLGAGGQWDWQGKTMEQVPGWGAETLTQGNKITWLESVNMVGECDIRKGGTKWEDRAVLGGHVSVPSLAAVC